MTTASNMSRRKLVKNSAALVAGAVGVRLARGIGILTAASRKPSDIRVDDISLSYDEHLFRAPVGFAGAVVDRASMVTVNCSVRTAGGKIAGGFGTK